jgi:hypothetical protein
MLLEVNNATESNYIVVTAVNYLPLKYQAWISTINQIVFIRVSS